MELHPSDRNFLTNLQFFWKQYLLVEEEALSDYGHTVRNEMFKIIQPQFARLIEVVDYYETQNEKQNA